MIDNERDAQLFELRKMLIGQPKRWNWQRQKYNAGHDQAIHKVARKIMGVPSDYPSPLEKIVPTNPDAE